MTGSNDSTVGVYDIQTGRRLQSLVSDGLSVDALAFSLTERLVFGGGGDKITVWDLNTANIIQQVSLEDSSSWSEGLAYEPDTRLLYRRSRDDISLVDLNSTKTVHTLSKVASFQEVLAFDSASKLTAVRIENAPGISIVDFETGAVKHQLNAEIGWPSRNLLHPKQDCLFTGSEGKLERWSLSRKERQLSVDGWFNIQHYSPNSDRLFAIVDECCVAIIDASRGEIEQTIEFDHEVHALYESADGQLFVSYCKGEVGVCNLNNGKQTQEFAAQNWSYKGLSYDRESDELIAVSGRYCDIWDASDLSFKQTWETKMPQANRRGRNKKVPKRGAASQRLYVRVTPDDSMTIWDRTSNSCLGRINRKDDSLRTLILDATNRRIYCGTWDHTIEVFDIETCKQVAVLEGHENSLRTLDIDPVSGQLFSACENKDIKIWDIETGTSQATIAYPAILTNFVFDPSLEKLLLVDGGGYECDRIKLFDPKTQDVEFSFCGHHGIIRSIAIDAENRRLFSTSDDNTIRVWDIDRRECTGVMRTDDDMNAIALSPPNGEFLSFSNEGKQYGHYLLYDENNCWLNDAGEWTIEEL